MILIVGLASRPAEATVVYDFESVPLGAVTPIVFPDGARIDSATSGPDFHIVDFNLGRVRKHVLRDEPSAQNQRSLRITFPQSYNSISMDFALNASGAPANAHG